MARLPAWVFGLSACIAVGACGGAPNVPSSPREVSGAHEQAQQPDEKVERDSESGPSREELEKVEKAEEAEEEADTEEAETPPGEAKAPERQTQALMTVDPCSFATAAQLKDLINAKLVSLFPKKYKKYRFKLPKSVDITCPSGLMGLKASVVREIKWLPDLKGKIELNSPLIAKVDTAGGPTPTEATLCMGKLNIKKIDFKYVPSFLEKGLRSVVNKVLNKALPGNVCGDVKIVKNLVAARMAKGPLQPAAPAAVEPAAAATPAKPTKAPAAAKPAKPAQKTAAIE